MVVSDTVSASQANTVEGFSARFNSLLDRAQLPRNNRVMIGARRFDVVPNTFKAWCQGDRIPRQHAVLMDVVTELLNDVPGQQNPKAVLAWLLAGDAVPNPFEHDGTALAVVEIYFLIVDLAQERGIDFGRLPRKARDHILQRVSASVLTARRGSDNGEELTIDPETAEKAVVMLETAASLA